MPLTFNATELLAVIGGAAGLVTLVWHSAMYVGKMTVRLDRVEDRVDDHDERLGRAERWSAK